MEQVDRDYLGVEDLIKEQFVVDELERNTIIQRGDKVAFTTQTPGWKDVILPFLEKKLIMPAVSPSKEGWEREYQVNFALVTVVSELIGMVNNWVAQAEDLKERGKESK